MPDDRVMMDVMLVDEFLAFTETRPDDEKWELIDGEAILNASPNRLHQRIVQNLLFELEATRRAFAATWEVIPGIAVRVSDRGAPVPDVMVRPDDDLRGNICDDMIVAFEVLSASTARRDLGWKRSAYALLPSLQRYVVVVQDEASVVAFRRANNWREEKIASPDATVSLPELGIELPLRRIYRGTGLA